MTDTAEIGRKIRRAIESLQNGFDRLESAQEDAEAAGMMNVAKDLDAYIDDLQGLMMGLDMTKANAMAASSRTRGDAGAHPDSYLSDAKSNSGRKLEEARHGFNLGFVGDSHTGSGPKISGFGKDVPIITSLAEVYGTTEGEEEVDDDEVRTES